MKKVLLSLSVLAMCFASCKKEVKVETEVSSTDTTKVITMEAPETEEPMDSVAEMKAWQAYMTPGDAHKMLASEAGSWNNEMTFWHDADSKPEKATSTAEIKMILGGRYQEANYKGNMMGMPFEGRGTVAYDNSTGEYTSTWIDNMGTGMMVMKGKMGSDGKTLELKGKMVDPARKKETNCREVYTIVDANTRKMEMYCDKNGKELKNMEIVMKRK
jgi:hypothetical protein